MILLFQVKIQSYVLIQHVYPRLLSMNTLHLVHFFFGIQRLGLRIILEDHLQRSAFVGLDCNGPP